MASASTDPKVTISAVITRADGTVEDLGVVCTNVTTAGPSGLVLLKSLLKGKE